MPSFVQIPHLLTSIVIICMTPAINLPILVICCKYSLLLEARYNAPKHFPCPIQEKNGWSNGPSSFYVKDGVTVVPWNGRKVIVTDVARSLGPSFGGGGIFIAEGKLTLGALFSTSVIFTCLYFTDTHCSCISSFLITLILNCVRCVGYRPIFQYIFNLVK